MSYSFGLFTFITFACIIILKKQHDHILASEIETHIPLISVDELIIMLNTFPEKTQDTLNKMFPNIQNLLTLTKVEN
jgi:hypothetical protein